jgi:hypothetical protein
MSVSVLFSAYIRAGRIDKNLQREIRGELLAAVEDDEEEGWRVVREYCDSDHEAIEWLRSRGFLDLDNPGWGVKIRARLTHYCSDDGAECGDVTTILPDGTEYRGTFSCCGWKTGAEPSEDEDD